MAHQLNALCAPSVNSYDRRMAQQFSGGANAWGRDNRTVAFRVVGQAADLRIEHRYAGADANPYCAVAALLAAGMCGVDTRQNLDLPVQGDAYARPHASPPPRTLDAAAQLFREAAFNRAAFGTEVVEHYAELASAEWERYTEAITDWELERGFENA